MRNVPRGPQYLNIWSPVGSVLFREVVEPWLGKCLTRGWTLRVHSLALPSVYSLYRKVINTQSLSS